MTNAEKVLSAARAEIGTKEQPANSNNVKYNTWYYGRAVSGSAYPWCMAFVQWCFAQAGMRLPCVTASCGSLLGWYRKNAPACVVTEPLPGDVAIFNWPGTKYTTDHTGLVERVEGTRLVTIEGNTAIGNDSNGGAVMRRTRERKYVNAFIRPRALWEDETAKEAAQAAGEQEDETVERFNAIKDMPDWAQSVIRKLVDEGVIGGTGSGAKDADGRPADLDLSADMLRLLVVNDRAGLYGA